MGDFNAKIGKGRVENLVGECSNYQIVGCVLGNLLNTKICYKSNRLSDEKQ